MAMITNDMILETRAVGPFFKNGFVLGCEETHEAVLIDPGEEVDDLLVFAKTSRLEILHILLTHAHVDHITGVAAAKLALRAPIYLHRDDLFLYDNAVSQGAMFGLNVRQPPPVDVFYSPGQVIRFGKYEAMPHHTPGHCPGGVCLQVGSSGSVGKRLFVGDTLFAGSIGRTDLPGGDYATLIRSIRTVLFAFGDDADVYPGHGPRTTIGHERRTNPFLTATAD
jgi:hydroxyacylglutathione hydrolase